jgi:transcriptional regulator with XRE-family HTH domain
MPRRSNGPELRRRRELLGMTLTEFATRTGYTLNYASQVELGNSNGGPKYLRAAADLLACEIDDISTEVRRTTRRRRSASSATATAEKRASA